ncbi:hypothetical protein H9L39_13896 [Fusarium oxysporum f. sp. albedinis]|nr:hypothetical protein H9L39_13896 [Fusarium oxysporum f. sp. albedinis]
MASLEEGACEFFFSSLRECYIQPSPVGHGLHCQPTRKTAFGLDNIWEFRGWSGWIDRSFGCHRHNEIRLPWASGFPRLKLFLHRISCVTSYSGIIKFSHSLRGK